MSLFKVGCGRRVAFMNGMYSHHKFIKVEGNPTLLFYGWKVQKKINVEDVVVEKDNVLIEATSLQAALKIFNNLEEAMKGVMWRRQEDQIIEIQHCEDLGEDGLCHQSSFLRKCKLKKTKYCLQI